MCIPDRTAYAPDIDLARYPALVALKSTNNTPIESLWHWFQDQCGKNLYLQITKGRDEGLFNPNNQIHVYIQVLLSTETFLISSPQAICSIGSGLP